MHWNIPFTLVFINFQRTSILTCLTWSETYHFPTGCGGNSDLDLQPVLQGSEYP